MTTLIYPSDQITITEGFYSTNPEPFGKVWEPRFGVIVADGVCPQGKHRPDDHLCQIAGQVPPADLVALTEPCPTCGGDEFVCDNDGCPDCHPIACPDCRGGKQTFTLEQPCPHEHAEQLDGTNDWSCADCGSKGHDITEWDNAVINLGDGWVITDLLPIVDEQSIFDGTIIPPKHVIWRAGSTEAWAYVSTPPPRITLPPAARPGMWAALIEQETP